MTRFPEQEIRFCISKDGVRIAFAKVGSGPPFVKTANWLSHLEFDWNSPVWRHWMRELSRDHTFIRYDARGCGLSDSNAQEYSLDCWVQDLEAVVDAAGLERFPLLGISQGGPIAMEYARRHPERVTHLILYGTYAKGLLHRNLPQAEAERDVLLQLIRVGWGKEHAAFRQVFTSLFLPEGTPEQIQDFNELQRVSSTPENAARMIDAFHNLDVTDVAKTIRIPCLVLHARGDLRIPFEEGRRLASLLPNARFVPLESRNHILMETEPAWKIFASQVRSFLGVPDESVEKNPAPERWAEIGDLFEKALQIPEEQRNAFLDEKCAHDSVLRKEVESLIARADKTGLSSKLGSVVSRSAASWLSSSFAIQPVQSAGNYEILEKIGEGGMGLVFKARDLKLERIVALKILPDFPGDQQKTRLRFIREARAAAALDHPNICTIYEIDETQTGLLFISMAYYQGAALNEIIKRDAPLPLPIVQDYALQIAEGLAHAHEHGVVHRDIKPANMFVTLDRRIKILDFGIAQVAEGNLTQSGAVMGTLAYMSPEQASGQHVGAQSDLFSLGVMLYEMLTGKQPFTGGSQYVLLSAIQNDEAPAIGHLRPELSESWIQMIHQLLQKDPARRFQSSAELIETLKHL
jgi:pimeloyl-ACP methyl ester carboxylesterase/tRNA A-37 threonylcarbamoyl transferase component Bud32